MTDIGELVVRIKADAAQLEREMQKAHNTVQQAAGGMSKATQLLTKEFSLLSVAIPAAAMAAFVQHSINVGDHLNDLSKRTGVAVETLSALKVLAEQEGTSIDTLAQSIKFMNNNLAEAAGNNKTAASAFTQLGLSITELQQLSVEERFKLIAQRISELGTQSERTKAMMDVFNRSGVELSGVMENGAAGIQAAIEKAKELGIVLSTEDAAKMDAFNDQMTELGARTEHFGMTVATIATPAVLDLIKGLDELLSREPNTSKFFNELGVGMIGVGAKLGLIDQDVADAAAEIAGERSKKPLRLDIPNTNSDKTARKLPVAPSDEIVKAKKSLDDYNESLQRQNIILQQSPREQAALEAGYKTMDLAQKAGIKDASELIAANENLARTNYDLAQSMQEAARFQQELHDKLSSTLTDVVFKAGSAKEAMLGFAESIAKAAFEKKIAGPISDALIGTGGSKGLLDGVLGSFGGFFADGGTPPVGVPSIVGERGPEIFVPKSAGTIIPNGAMGGHTVNVYQNFQVSNDVPALIQAHMRNAAPQIAAAAHNSVFQALQKGGNESRIAGLR